MEEGPGNFKTIGELVSDVVDFLGRMAVRENGDGEERLPATFIFSERDAFHFGCRGQGEAGRASSP